MRCIPLLEIDDEKLFDGIADAKYVPRGAQLTGVRATVFAAYRAYRQAAPEVGALPAIAVTEEQKSALLHAYDVETAPFGKVRGELLERVVSARCPFCGLSESSTLDHYLPKQLNPQFSVYSKNLIPSCSLCNSRKLEKVVDQKTNVRVFLHPYFDHIPDLPFLTAVVTLAASTMGVAFQITRLPGMSCDTVTRLQSHFTTLGLASRYRLMSLEHLRPQHPAFLRLYGDDKDPTRISTDLELRATDLEAGYGVNYWNAVLYRALATNTEFCDGGFSVLKSVQ